MTRSLRLLGVAALHLGVLWLWIAALDAKRGPVPPLGKFLSPFEGFWRNAEPRGVPRGAEVVLEGLTGTVVAEFDRRGVPHLFAPDLYSLFFAQGYVTARDRLWQMDIQSRAGAGRLSEVMGSGLLRFDLERRRMGMPASARASLELMRRDSLTRVALEAYADGVNSWISSLKPAGYPLEFKLLDYAPERWTPLKSVYLVKNMQWTLSRGHDDVRLTRVLDSLGRGFLDRYYPARHPGAEPVFPDEVLPGSDSGDLVHAGEEGGGDSPRPAASSGGALAAAGGLPAAYSDSLWPRPDPGSGSNNFVIAAARTRAGAPLLANDPHLDLTLPSLWYETQLKSGDLNAYGVSLPGLPGLVIGFTRETAWGLTNGMNDVFDWHELRFRDDSRSHYLWRGRWRPVRLVPDTILVRGRPAVTDTQLWTHAGPVPVRHGEAPFGPNTPPLHALQWTALEPSNELGAFLRLLTARDVVSFRRAVRGLETPAQNIVFATRRDIALVHQGRVPAKRAGQGRLVARGNVSATEWRRDVPVRLLPASVNPPRGWLASANQELLEAGRGPYFGSHFYPPERSQRLNRLLFNEREATLSSSWDILRDNYSRHAARALPLLLRHLPAAGDGARDTVAADSSRRDDPRRAAADVLRAWDYRYGASDAAPVLFDLWWGAFHRGVWDDDLGGDTAGLAYPRPSRPVTLDLLAADTLADVFDDARTPGVETAGDIARAAFDTALARRDRMIAARGPGGDDGPLTWGRYRPVTIPHLLRLAPLGAAGLTADGCAECVNAQKESHGPSWRMAVQVGRAPEAWGIYPGGQSGNPGSPRYDAFVRDWAEGRAYRLLFLRWPLDVPDSTAYLLALKGKK